MGIYEKVPFNELDWDIFWNYNFDIKYSELETMKSVYERIFDFLEELKRKNTNNNNILLVTHGGVSKAFNGYFEGIKDGKFLNRGLKNCEIKEYEL